MNSKRIGKRTAALQTPPSVLSFANIGGRMEGQGPLAKYFDELCDDSFFVVCMRVQQYPVFPFCMNITYACLFSFESAFSTSHMRNTCV